MPKSPRRRQVTKQAAALMSNAQRGIASPGGHTTANRRTVGSYAHLRVTLRAVRRDVLHRGAGKHTALVVSALANLDQYLVLMTRSMSARNPTARLALVAAAQKRLDQAHVKARKAGHDWPL